MLSDAAYVACLPLLCQGSKWLSDCLTSSLIVQFTHKCWMYNLYGSNLLFACTSFDWQKLCLINLIIILLYLEVLDLQWFQGL